MCHPSCLEFGQRNIGKADVFEKKVLEVGSYNVNGSLKSLVETFSPEQYIGIDLHEGPGVDEVCTAEDIVERFGCDKFDLLINTEMLEHVHDWRLVVYNMKQVIKPGGILIITTRSRGYGLHGYPSDYWRFEISDFQHIFSDMAIEELVSDPSGGPGVFLRARKTAPPDKEQLEGYELYSVITGNRTRELNFSKGLMARFKVRLWLATQRQYVKIAILRLALWARPYIPAKIKRSLKQWAIREHEKRMERLQREK